MALTQVDQGLLSSTAQYTGFKNRIINGAMMVDQRNAGASVTPTASAYTLDRWQANLSVTSKYSVQQQTSVVPAGFSSAMKITSLSAYSVGAGENFAMAQSIEGYNIADLGWGTANAQAVTLSFRVYSSLTGTFGGSLINASANRSYPFTYSIPAANTWTTISITVAGDTSGTWGTTNGTGIGLYFGLGVGSTSSGTAGSWAGSLYFSATGATSVVGTNLATFYITGVQLEKGSTATSFDYRPYGTELMLCQRYFQQWDGSGAVCMAYGNTANTNLVAVFPLKVTMRTAPTGITVSSAGAFSIGNVVGTISAIAFSAGNKDAVTMVVTSSGTYASLTASQLKCDTSAQITFTGSEL